MQSHTASSRTVSDMLEFRNNPGILLLMVLSVCSSLASSFLIDPPHTLGKRQHSMMSGTRYGTESESENPEVSRKRSLESTFWHVVPDKSSSSDSSIIPHSPLLDSTGALPSSAYRRIGDSDCDVAKTCLLGIAVDASDDSHPMDTVRGMHAWIDSGFGTFQMLDSGDEDMFGLLRKETPASVMRECHLMSRLIVPDGGTSFGFGDGVRRTISSLLLKYGGDCLDSVQLVSSPSSPYHLDALDVLSDLKREGIIRSINANNFSESLLTSAHDCDLKIDSNQIPSNLIRTSPHHLIQNTCQQQDTKILTTTGLAGGLLSNRFLQYHRGEPPPQSLTPSQRKHLKYIRNQKRGWDYFYKEILTSLRDIAMKHDVDVSAVALRYMMQLDRDTLGSVVMRTRVQKERPDGVDRISQTRQIFKFHLDDQDMDRLNYVGLWGQRPTNDEELDEFSQMESSLNDRSLWL